MRARAATSGGRKAGAAKGSRGRVDAAQRRHSAAQNLLVYVANLQLDLEAGRAATWQPRPNGLRATKRDAGGSWWIGDMALNRLIALEKMAQGRAVQRFSHR